MKKELQKIRQLSETSIEYNNAIIREVDEILGFQIPKPTIKHGDGFLLVEWESFISNKEVDILFYAKEKHEAWSHSVNEYLDDHGKPVDPAKGRYKIGLELDDPGRYQWYVKMKVGDDEGKESILEPKKNESETITIIESNPSKGDWYAGVNGILKMGDKWRVYFQDRTDSDIHQVVYSESKDLKEWTDPKAIGTTKTLSFVQHPDGQIYAYGEDDGWMCIWESSDGIDQYSNRVRAFQWKLDTIFTLYFHEKNHEPRMFGRVRGNGIGGWEDNPDLDRRGISYHKAEKINANWQSRILADPMDYFDYANNLRPDFYQPSFRSDSTGEIIVFWRDRNNKISKPDETTRITGPIYPIPASYSDGKISIESYEPAIDIRSFSKSEKEYGDITVQDVGQIYIHPVKLPHEGQFWRVISRRSDEHYRRSEADISGVYLIQEKE